MKLFQVVRMRSHINCNLPLIVVSGKLDEKWKNIRTVIFNHILDHTTKECASEFKLGFYEIIISRMINL